MFAPFLGFDGAPIMIQARHIMAFSQSAEQKTMQPQQVTLLMACGTGSEEWLVQGSFEQIQNLLHDDFNWG